MLEKRKWVYLSQPRQFEMTSCSCGNDECQWSEYKGHLWCDKCQKDFIPSHNGVFEGPIPVGAAAMMGIVFDRFNLETQKIETFNTETSRYNE